jgi:hypothetical protein
LQSGSGKAAQFSDSDLRSDSELVKDSDLGSAVQLMFIDNSTSEISKADRPVGISDRPYREYAALSY